MSIDEKGLKYIPKATSAPPRAGTTGNHYIHICGGTCIFCVYVINIDQYRVFQSNIWAILGFNYGDFNQQQYEPQMYP